MDINIPSITLVFLVLFHSIGYSQNLNSIAEKVTFKNGSITLSGVLTMPKKGGSHPAIVFLHGSGPHTHKGFLIYAAKFAQLGIASLAFDKRGTGQSEGSWIHSSIYDLADDALAAITYLKSRPEIDTNRIGFWGISQAGWVAPIAYSKSEDVAFMIIISGGGSSPKESEEFSYKKWFEKLELTKEEKDEGMKLVNEYMSYLSSKVSKEYLDRVLENVKNPKLKKLSERLNEITPSETNRKNWEWVSTYDPLDDIKNITCSVLLLFGGEDDNHPTELSIKKWEQGLELSNNDDFSIINFPEAGHGIRMRRGYKGKGRAPFADGYWEVQIGWLFEKLFQ